MQFVFEDHIDHTPKIEKVRLHLGDAFDVTADQKQTDFRCREPTNKATNNYMQKSQRAGPSGTSMCRQAAR